MQEYIILVVAMIAVGIVIGWFGDKIFKGERPKGLQGDILAATLTTIIVGLLDWIVIPMIIEGDTIRLLGVIFEPALGALVVLWIMRRASQV
jgi:uncharacterized membrane protein YeaQ/YmgE (transglycosylase-associated protein family)